MLNLCELEQLCAFARYGTLSKAAEELHISQPTLTRSMQHLEEEFGVALFVHGKTAFRSMQRAKKRSNMPLLFWRTRKTPCCRFASLTRACARFL